MRLDRVECRSNAPGIMPIRLRLAEKPPRTLGPSAALACYSSPIPHLHSTNLSHAQESAGRRGGWWDGVVGARGRSAAAVGRPFLCFCPWLRDGRAFMSFLRALRSLWAVACAHCVAQTFCYTWVCLSCVCGSGFFFPLDPLARDGWDIVSLFVSI